MKIQLSKPIAANAAQGSWRFSSVQSAAPEVQQHSPSTPDRGCFSTLTWQICHCTVYSSAFCNLCPSICNPSWLLATLQSKIILCKSYLYCSYIRIHTYVSHTDKHAYIKDTLLVLSQKINWGLKSKYNAKEPNLLEQSEKQSLIESTYK